MNKVYGEEFYDEQEKRSERIANEILPVVIEHLNPKSVVDFGCGRGIWLRRLLSIKQDVNVMGIDGQWVNIENLRIPKENFTSHDLGQVINLGVKYDLAMSLEVAEHIDEKFADVYFQNIIRASDTVLFSAAIPGQEGVHHVNEQWHSYWIEKFIYAGYKVDYHLRNYFWNNERISPWRRQNILLFHKFVDSPFSELPNNMVDVVHPEVFTDRVRRLNDISRLKETEI